MVKGIDYVKKRYFERGSVSVFGLRGRGKDMLMANVACRNESHISNVSYGKGFIPLDFDMLDIGNRPSDLVGGIIKPYKYPYPEGVDIYISDIGVYFPSQYYDALNRRYPSLPMFLALSRQLGQCNVHFNTQALGRVWDKFREQSDIYIRCDSCRVIGRLVIQRVTVYDRYDTALSQADPFWYPPCRLGANGDERRLWRNNRALALSRYLETHGNVERHTLIYVNKSNYDTRIFKRILEGGEGTA